MIFVRCEADAMRAKKEVAITIDRTMKEFENRDSICSLIVSVAMVSGADRVTIQTHTGGAQQLLEGAVLQMIYNLTIFPMIPWYRRLVYRALHFFCSTFREVKRS